MPITTPAGEAPELSAEDRAYLDKTFAHHPPNYEQAERYQTIRTQFRALAEILLLTCPPSRDRSVALTNLETAMFWANASIARSGK